MSSARQGWNILIFLIMMTIIMLLANNGYKIASNLFMTSRMRYRYHQELRLIEGLLTYGIQLCNENRVLLLSWGLQKSQTMYLNFNRWPSCHAESTFGPHSGYITITSYKGILHLGAQMSRIKDPIMAGHCDLRARDPKNTKGDLLVSGWHIQSVVSA